MDQFKQFLLEGRFPLVMSLPRNDPALAEAAWKNGADVVKVHVNVKHHAILLVSFEYKVSCGTQHRLHRRKMLGNEK